MKGASWAKTAICLECCMMQQETYPIWWDSIGVTLYFPPVYSLVTFVWTEVIQEHSPIYNSQWYLPLFQFVSPCPGMLSLQCQTWLAFGVVVVHVMKHIDKPTYRKSIKYLELWRVVLQKYAVRDVSRCSSSAGIFHKRFFPSTCSLFRTRKYVSKNSWRARFKWLMWQQIYIFLTKLSC